ncbi:MAG: HAD family hydrolase [Syntrophales bacterium]|nr:HAD family hydrolase [Syntrophales bacterium]
MNRLYLFDFDGVIVDSFSHYEQFVSSCLGKIGSQYSITETDFLDLFDDNFYEAIEKKGIPLDTFLESAAALEPIDYSHIEPFQSVVPVLEELSKNHDLVVISSNQSGPIEEVLSRTEMSHFFKAILGADYATSKTAKIRHAMKKWGKKPEETYYIGDTAGDMLEAKRAGVRSVAATWGWHPEERLRAAAPDYIVRTPGDLLALDGAKNNY